MTRGRDYALQEQIWTIDGNIAGVLYTPASADPAAPLLVCVHGGGCNSRYFTLKCASLLDAALNRGIPVLLFDRPGYGASAAPVVPSAITAGVLAVTSLIEAVHAQRPPVARRGLAMIGHSIGGAVALAYAARPGTHKLSGLCVSGIGDRPMPAIAGTVASSANVGVIEPPAHWFFGPERTYGWQGPAALRAATQPWRADEVAEVIHAWPPRWPMVAAAITCPVQLRLAEFEQIWEATPSALSRIANALVNTQADVDVLPEGGHLYEAHLRGPELIASQLDFILAHGAQRTRT